MVRGGLWLGDISRKPYRKLGEECCGSLSAHVPGKEKSKGKRL